jgi:hypothetical protein
MDESAQIYTESGSPTVNYSIIQGGWSGSGGNNLSGDPLFFDPDGADNIIGTLDDDPSLRAGSPAIDAGDSTALPLDTFDLDGDLNTAERMPIDLAGNARQFDDPSTPDTGVPGSPVVDMGAYEYFTDCNGNGVEDSVDISQSTSEDCDWDGGGPNGTPDECDIAACPERTCFGGVYNGAPCEVDAECVAGVCGNQAAAACADCNLNDAPDGCDIDLGSSLDVAPMDGVPDECVNFTAGCNPPSNEWSCGGNWTLGGDYPDNDTVSYSVVLNGTADAVCLDVTVDIDSLDIVHGASLQVTEPDPPCDGASANRGPSGTNLDVVTDAGVSVLDSSLTVAGDNAINVLNGPLTIGPGGSYSLDPGATLVSSAVLSVSELFIIGSDCYAEPCSHGGQLVLVDSMEVSTSGDLVLDGTLANGDCELTRGATLAARSFHAPPIKHVGDSSIIFVGGNVVYAGAANVVYESTEPMVVAGDFANNSVRPDCFDYLNGAIRLEGTSPQTFEAAGRDIGPVDSIADAEFAIADITIASGSQVTFRDNFDNDLSSQASCSEAQYVGTLTLEAGAAATFANCRVYYETLQRHPSATVSFTGCGELRSIANPLATLVEPSPTPKNRFISFVVPTGGAPEDTAIRVRLRSLHHPAGPPNAPNLSAFEGQYRYLNAIRDGGNNPVFTCPDSAAFNTNFRCATLGCAPEYRDWAGIFGGAAVHVTDDSLVPSSQYEVAQIAGSCAGNEANCTAISTGLAVATERWGNVDNTPSGGAPSAIDIGFIVSKVKDAPGAFTKPRCQLQGATPNPYGLAVSALDIGRGVDAVKGQPYPFTISACP